MVQTRDCFHYNSTENVSTCTIENDGVPCNKKYAGKHKTNLNRHLLDKHRLIYDQIKADEKKKPGNSNTLINSHFKPVRREIVKKQIQFTTSTQYVDWAILKTCTVDGRPFIAIEDKGYQDLLRPYVIGLEISHKFDRKYARKLVVKAAIELENKIKNEITNRMVCIKLDGGTRNGRKFMGVNLQFRDGDMKFKLYTLGCIELFKTSTSANIADEVAALLTQYNININMVYSATTDNGCNYVKAVHLLQKMAIDDQDVDDSDSSEFYLDDVFEIEEDEEEAMDNLINGVVNQLAVNGVRCVVHTFQLAIRDWLKKNKRTEDLLDQIRRIVAKFRTPNMIIKMKKLNFMKKLILDCATRWTSTFAMMERFVEAKSVINDLSEEEPFTDEEWSKIDELLQILKYCNTVTLGLQNEELIIGDAYKYWHTCVLQLRKMGIKASSLLQELNEREKQCFNSVVFSANIYLDPRFKMNLTPSQKKEAEEHLFKLYKKLAAIAPGELKQNPDSSSEDLVQKQTKSKNEELFNHEAGCSVVEFEEYMREKNNYETSTFLEEVKNRQTFELELERYFVSKPMGIKEDVVSFWKKDATITLFPSLAAVAPIIFSVPATEVSVERLFSELHFILSDLRASLKSNIIDKILMVRRNFTVLYP